MAICVALVLALGAVTAAGASAAAPEFGRCVKVAKGTGKFTTGKCTQEGVGGSFEWIPGPGAMNKFSFAEKPETVVTWETVGGTKIVCRMGPPNGGGEVGNITGEYTGAKSVQLTFRLTECETSGCAVESPGQPEGVVLSNVLDGNLGIEKIGATPKETKVGLDLFNPTGGALFEAACNGVTIVVTGSVITAPLKTNSMVLSETFKLAQGKGKQKPEHLEGEPNDVLAMSVGGGPPEQMGFGLIGTLTNEEKIEINTFV